MTIFEVGSVVEHRRYGRAVVLENTTSGVRVRYEKPPVDLDGECEDVVCEESLQAASPYSDTELTEIVSQHFSRLYNPDDQICLTFIHSSKKTASGVPVTENFCLPMSRAVTRTSIARMQIRNEDGWNVYAAMNPLQEGAQKRKKELSGTPRNVFMEVDDGGEQALIEIHKAMDAKEIPAPSIILCSSPKKYQLIWRIVSEDFTFDKVEALNKALVDRFGGDPACTDHLRVFRVPFFRNWKYAQRPVVEMVEKYDGQRRLEDFKIKVVEAKTTENKLASSDDQLVYTVSALEEAAAQAGIVLSTIKKWGDNGFIWELECPWIDQHTHQAKSGTVIILHKSGALDFVCRHNHCLSRSWVGDFRPYLEDKVGHTVRFSEPKIDVVMNSTPSAPVIDAADYTSSDGAIVPPETKIEVVGVLPVKNIDLVGSRLEKESALPEFDTKIIKGFYSDLVGLASEGNTLPKQFLFGISKAFVGLRCATRTVLEGCDLQPRYYFFMIGETGAGKGASWLRIRQILTANGAKLDFNKIIKIVDSVDSGAGLKDTFFYKDEGHGIPVMMFVDELTNFTSKSRTDRNPEILSEMLSLSDSNNVSRIKANSEKSCSNAKFSTVICAQPSLISSAFAGIRGAEVGLYDRLTLDIAYPHKITRTLRPLDPALSMAVSLAYDALPYDSTIKDDAKATDEIAQYLDSLPIEQKSNARRLGRITADAYMFAFGRRSPKIDVEDALSAVYLDKRSQVLRDTYLKGYVSDIVSAYSQKIKDVWKSQYDLLKEGRSQESVMLSESQFMSMTNAYRNNAEVSFKRAWASVVDTLFYAVETESRRGPKTKRYLPREL